MSNTTVNTINVGTMQVDVFDAKTKKLYLHRVLDNRSITPAFLRSQIENFVGNMKSTADLWKFTK